MDRRREPRIPAQAMVLARAGSKEASCRMRNLSAHGCMLEDTALLAEVGARISVGFGDGFEVQGEIAWQLGQSVGIAFSTPISTNLVEKYSSRVPNNSNSNMD